MTLGDLLDGIRAYNTNAEFDRIRDAYEYARDLHDGQTRLTGEAYIEHPMAVAGIVVQLRLDQDSVIAALLHDAVEDTGSTIDDIRARFGASVAGIVDGLTTLSSVFFRSKKISQAENFRKMLVAMSKDIRVLLVKLADRLHNMRTLQPHPKETREKIARETMEIYAPLANRLGINWMKTELEDLSFRFLYEDDYQRLRALVSKKKHERETYTEEVESTIKKALAERSSVKGKVYGRAKHFYSIFRKMKRQGIEFDQVYDLIAFRILADAIPQCYEALGLIHTIWKPIPGRFKDYIALPKPNGYQSLHTAVIGPYGEKLEVQIRTKEMHRVAEQGIAAHWKYKEGKGSSLKGRDEQEFAWLKQLIEWQQELRDPNEFIDTVKVELFQEEVYVFTPGGDLRVLPKGATPLDFAYSIHTEVGHSCRGAKVNGRIAQLTTKLKNGDRIQILTQAGGTPKRDWLDIVASSKAKNKIRAFLRQEEKEHSRDRGKAALEKEFRRFGRGYEKLVRSGELLKAGREFKATTVEELCILVGGNKVAPEQVSELVIGADEAALREIQEREQAEREAAALAAEEQREKRRRRSAKSAVVIGGIDEVLVHYAKCCQPLPGEDVVGFVTRGRGMTIHRRNCRRVKGLPAERVLDVSWAEATQHTYAAKIRVTTLDETGALGSLTDVITRHGVNITQALCRQDDPGTAVHTFNVSVKALDQLTGLMSSLGTLREVIHVERLRN